MQHRKDTCGDAGITASEPTITRIEGADTELGVCRFTDGAVVVVAQSTHSTVMVPLTPAQAVRLAHALLGAQ